MKSLPEEIKIRIAADESLITPKDALDLVKPPFAAGIFNIKLMKCGGLSQGLKIAGGMDERELGRQIDEIVRFRALTEADLATWQRTGELTATRATVHVPGKASKDGHAGGDTTVRASKAEMSSENGASR